MKNYLNRKRTTSHASKRSRFAHGFTLILLFLGASVLPSASAQTPSRPRWIDFGTTSGFSNFRRVDWNDVVRVIFHRGSGGYASVAVSTNSEGRLTDFGDVTNAALVEKIRTAINGEPLRWVRMQISLPNTGAWQDPSQYEAYGDLMQVKRITVTQSIDNPTPDPANPGEYHLALTDSGMSIGRVIVPAEKIRLRRMIDDSWLH